MPGLRDEVFDSDGTMTKREVRAVTLAALAPVAGETLWDVGAGSGSISVEWARAAAGCRAYAVEPRADRRERIAANVRALDASGVEVVAGSAPEALSGLPSPDAVFVGGGLTVPGVADAVLGALARRPGGGRLVVNAATLQTERIVAELHERFGGDLVRLEISRVAPLGGFSAWRPMQPVTQWSCWIPGEGPAAAPGRPSAEWRR